MTDDSAAPSLSEKATSADTTVWYWVATLVILSMAVVTVMALLANAGS